MDGTHKAPEYVVTVLRENVPIGVVNISNRLQHSSDIDIWYDGAEDLRNVQTALMEAQSGVSYLIWKETGELPPPPDLVGPEVTEPLPF